HSGGIRVGQPAGRRRGHRRGQTMTSTVAARLSAQPFFAVLTEAERGALAEDGTAVTFAAGERPFDEGGVADMFWLIERGSVALDMRVPGRGDQIVET